MKFIILLICWFGLLLTTFAQNKVEIKYCKTMSSEEFSLSRLNVVLDTDTVIIPQVGADSYLLTNDVKSLIKSGGDKSYFLVESCKYDYEIKINMKVILSCANFEICISDKKTKGESGFSFRFCGSQGVTGFAKVTKR